MSDKIIDFKNNKVFKKKQEENIRVFSHSVSAGTLSCVDDTVESVININDIKLESLKGRNPEHLYIVSISGNSMFPLLKDKQQVIVDNWLANTLNESELIGKIVIARVDNEHTIKRFNADRKYFYLIPENPEFRTIKVRRNDEGFRIIGIMVDILQGQY